MARSKSYFSWLWSKLCTHDGRNESPQTFVSFALLNFPLWFLIPLITNKKWQNETGQPTVLFEKARFTSWCHMSEARRQAKHNLCSLSYLRLKKNAAKLPKTKIMTDGVWQQEKWGVTSHKHPQTALKSDPEKK